MNGTPDITYSSTPGVTPKQVRDTRARAWAFVFDCHKKRTAPESRPDDTKEGLNGSCRNTIIPERP